MSQILLKLFGSFIGQSQCDKLCTLHEIVVVRNTVVLLILYSPKFIINSPHLIFFMEDSIINSVCVSLLNLFNFAPVKLHSRVSIVPSLLDFPCSL